ncbi:MAG: UDP-N-acetylmuramate dehydrogenase [Clostridia bacterium]|nr:UDP-N-acetylmuramate dehydrogenase [Clostridia bacterium]
MNYASLETLCRDIGVKYSLNEPLGHHTSMKIGGECDILVQPNSEQALVEIIRLCRAQDMPYFVLGKGSNVLVSGNGYRGCIVLLSKDFSEVAVNGGTITAAAGASLKSVCMAALDNSLTGLEFAYGIPGSVGGALYMNAGAYGGEMKDVVKSCRYIDENGDIVEMNAADMSLSYRHSFFSGKKCVIVSVTMELKQGDKAEIKAKMDDLMGRRKDKQPLEFPSCGSTFKRPEGYFAAALIEECGLKGCTIGGAQVSEKHSGFVINKGGASFEDVTALVAHIKKTVKEQKGVDLECEMLILE